MKSTRYEQISELLSEINNYDIYPIVARRLDNDFDASGYYGKARFLCPFHDDEKTGNFHMKGRTFKCFSCGAKGNAISFVEKYDNLKFTEAVTQVALEYGIIDKQTANKLNQDKSLDLTIKKVTPKTPIKKIVVEKEIVHKILSCFSKGLTYLNKPKLSEKHYNHLLKERNLTDEQIENEGYFTFPSMYIMKYLLRELDELGISDSYLQYIPGFYYDEKKEKYCFTVLKNNTGIGIPIRDENGLIVAIQIRLDNTIDGGLRYIWFSSSFVGNSPGTPVDVCYPDGYDITNIKDSLYSVIFITEGHFKATRLAREFNTVAISVQGVQNWKQLPYTLDTLQKANPKFKNIYIMYDADMSYKDSVLQASLKLGLSLTNLTFNGVKNSVENILSIRKDSYKSTENKPKPLKEFEKEFEKVSHYLRYNAGAFKFNVKYCLWKAQVGKGIDDYLDAFESKDEATSHILKVSLIDFWENIWNYLLRNDKDRWENNLNEEKKKENFLKQFLIP